MVSFAVLALELFFSDEQSITTSVQDMSAISFTYRLPKAVKNEVVRMELNFHRLQGDESCTIQTFTVDLQESAEDYNVYRVEMFPPGVSNFLKRVMQDIMAYTHLRQTEDMARISQRLIGYNEKKQAEFAATPREWMQKRMENLHADDEWLNVFSRANEVAIFLHGEAQADLFIREPWEGFKKSWFAFAGLTHHPIAGVEVQCIYLGSECCVHLLQSSQRIMALTQCAIKQNLRPVLVLPPCEEHFFDQVLSLATAFISVQESQMAEIVVNDWGLASAIHRRYGTGVTLTLGTMLTKSRRDSRLRLMAGYGGREQKMSQSGMSDGFKKAMQSALGIKKITISAFAACGTSSAMPYCLQLPFYATNTAGNCTLSAQIKTGSRGRQDCVLHCDRLCKHAAVIYPESVESIGIGNTIYGFDRFLLERSGDLTALIQKECKRVVLDIPGGFECF